MTERFLVTGAYGCLGAWTVKHLLQDQTEVVAFDLDTNSARWKILMSDDEIARVPQIQGDITDTSQIDTLIQDHGITHVVHLAGLVYPYCQANPVRGASVNIMGTMNVFSSAASHKDMVQGISYAGSVASYRTESGYPVGEVSMDTPMNPSSFYGAYKEFNEKTANLYALEYGIGSVGLRVPIVYGPGRDRGITADITLAMVKAAAGDQYEIAFGGTVALAFAADVARDFISSARSGTTTSQVQLCNAQSVEVESIIESIDKVAPVRGLITHGTAIAEGVEAITAVNDVPYILRSNELTPINEGIAETMSALRRR